MRECHEALQQYLLDIANYPPVSAEEESQLAQRIAAGDQEAKQRLVEAHLRLAVRLARPYAGRGIDLLDLIQQASLGLMEAAERFDPREGRFATYATWWARKQIMLVVSGQRRELSLEQETTLMETITDEGPLPEEAIHLQQLNAHLYATFACLNERERLVLVLRYGLDGCDRQRTLAEVGCQLGVTASRTRQIEQNALRKLRHSGSSSALEDYWSEHCAS